MPNIASNNENCLLRKNLWFSSFSLLFPLLLIIPSSAKYRTLEENYDETLESLFGSRSQHSPRIFETLELTTPSSLGFAVHVYEVNLQGKISDSVSGWVNMSRCKILADDDTFGEAGVSAFASCRFSEDFKKMLLSASNSTTGVSSEGSKLLIKATVLYPNPLNDTQQEKVDLLTFSPLEVFLSDQLCHYHDLVIFLSKTMIPISIQFLPKISQKIKDFCSNTPEALEIFLHTPSQAIGPMQLPEFPIAPSKSKETEKKSPFSIYMYLIIGGIILHGITTQLSRAQSSSEGGTSQGTG